MPRERFLEYRPNYNYHGSQRSIRRRSQVLGGLIYGLGSQLYNSFYEDPNSRPSRQVHFAEQSHGRYIQQRINRSGYNVHSTSSSSESESSSTSMPKGSYGTYHTTSAGRFGPTKRARYDASAAYARRGVVRESTQGGVVTDNNCVYLGHSPHPVDTTMFQIVVALVRSLFTHIDLEFENQNDIIPRQTDGIDFVKIDWLDNSGVVQTQSFGFAAGTDTFGNLAFSIYDFFKQAIVSNARRTYRRIYLGNSGGDSTLRATFNLAKCTVDILNSSYLKLQNSTQSHHEEAADDNDELQTNINAVPLKGLAYLGKSTWTGIEPYSYLGGPVVRGDAPAYIYPEVIAQPDNGFMTLRAPNSEGGVAAPLPYYNPPPAKSMFNIMGCSHVTLEPGCMKADALTFKYKATLNHYLMNAYVGGYSSNNSAGGLYSRSNLGTFKFFGLEKKINATIDKISVNYECNQVYRAKVYLPKEAMSLIVSNDKGSAAAIVDFKN